MKLLKSKRAVAFALFLQLALGVTDLFAAGYVVDPNFSSIEFNVRHMVISWVRGRFEEYKGSFEFDPATGKISNAKLDLKVKSINTDHDMRDAELMLPKFFWLNKYPEIKFRQTGFKERSGGKLEIPGDLTIKGQTRQVVLTGKFLGVKENGEGKKIVGFIAATEIKRSDFNLDWDIFTKTGAIIIGQEITIELKIQGTEK